MQIYLIKGARIIDPARQIDQIMDIRFGDKIIDIKNHLDPVGDEAIIDGTGFVVTPGIIDFHTHLFYNTGIPASWAGDWCIPPDLLSFQYGVTTMVDAGCAGWRMFDTFYTNVIERAQTRVFAFLNIASYGMISTMIEQDIQNDFDIEKINKVVKKYPQTIIGIKTAHYEKEDWLAVDSALAAGKETNLPVMVDFGYFKKERPYWEMLDKLRPGDISTHCFRGPVPLLDRAGHIQPYLFNAKKRGILFDVGHGGGSFLFQNAKPAMDQNFFPDIISTDLHLPAIMSGNMPNFPNLIDKFLALGMSFYDIIMRSCHIPSKVIGHEELGTLQESTPADITLWRINRKKFRVRDSYGMNMDANESVECLMTFQSGALKWDKEGILGLDYKISQQDLGIRPGEYRLFLS